MIKNKIVVIDSKHAEKLSDVCQAIWYVLKKYPAGLVFRDEVKLEVILKPTKMSRKLLVFYTTEDFLTSKMILTFTVACNS